MAFWHVTLILSPWTKMVVGLQTITPRAFFSMKKTQLTHCPLEDVAVIFNVLMSRHNSVISIINISSAIVCRWMLQDNIYYVNMVLVMAWYLTAPSHYILNYSHVSEVPMTLESVINGTNLTDLIKEDYWRRNLLISPCVYWFGLFPNAICSKLGMLLFLRVHSSVHLQLTMLFIDPKEIMASDIIFIVLWSI